MMVGGAAGAQRRRGRHGADQRRRRAQPRPRRGLALRRPPRAAVAIAPGPLSPLASQAEAPAPEITAPPAAEAAPEAGSSSARYAEMVRGVEQAQPGALAKLKALADAG